MFLKVAIGTIIGAMLAAIAFSASACDGRSSAALSTGASTPIRLIDDAGDTVRLAAPAKRIISLIPSATETIMALGATDRIVGRTRYDVAPGVSAVPSVGGGLDPSVESIVALHPDLVIGWDEDKRRAIREKLEALGIPVFSLRTQDTSDVFRGITNIGHALGRDSAATAVLATIRGKLDGVRRAVAGRPMRAVLFVVYPDPPMTAGPNTFVDQLIGLAGGKSIFNDSKQLWPTVSLEEIVRRAPDIVIVPQGEFKQNAIDQFRARVGWRDLAAVRAGRVVAVSADLTQRPGPNMGDAARALQAAIHPELAAAPK